MNNVIHIKPIDWHTLLMLRKNIKYYQSNYDPKYDHVLTKTKKLYSELLKEAA